MLAAIALLVLVATVTSVRTAAVVAKHRAESAADLAALAGAARIGVDGQMCAAARRTAARNAATLIGCATTLAPDGRSGTVLARVRLPIRLPFAGAQQVVASARAGRLP